MTLATLFSIRSKYLIRATPADEKSPSSAKYGPLRKPIFETSSGIMKLMSA